MTRRAFNFGWSADVDEPSSARPSVRPTAAPPHSKLAHFVESSGNFSLDIFYPASTIGIPNLTAEVCIYMCVSVKMPEW